MFDPQTLIAQAQKLIANPTMALAALAVFVAGYCDDNGVDREMFCAMIKNQPRKVIDV